MPFANNRGTRIHYEKAGSGPPLVLHHGTFGSGADFDDLGYVEALKQHRCLILLDSRGHGDSDKPHDPAAYDPALRAQDVLAVMDDLGVERADYFGYSLGGWVGFALARQAPERFNCLVLGGTHPYAENMQPFRDFLPADAGKLPAVIDMVFGGRVTPAMRSRLIALDLVAIKALTGDRESCADVLQSMKMPCLLLVGELDPRLPRTSECAAELANATLVTCPECDHIATFVRSDLMLPHITAFLAKSGL